MEHPVCIVHNRYLLSNFDAINLHFTLQKELLEKNSRLRYQGKAPNLFVGEIPFVTEHFLYIKETYRKLPTQCLNLQYFTMPQRREALNADVWREIERRSEKDRRELLKWQLQAREPITKFSDIEIGDHLVKRASNPITGNVVYYHHFLCTGRDSERKPIIIHYYNTPARVFKQIFNTLSFGSGSAAGQVARVQEYTLPSEEFIKSECELQEKGAEVERVVWPDELKRYPVDEVRILLNLVYCFSRK